MFLANVLHQDHARRSVHRALLGKRVPHAYIFHGPDGVGKETFARGLAQVLLCEARSGLDACGRCHDCRGVLADNHPDLHVIHRYLIRQHPDSSVNKRKGLDIGVDVIRHFLIDRAGLTPIRGRAKVFLIREADAITPQAQNALLKTLEEPPGPTYIFLLAASENRLLPTTRSRCQVVRFDALPAEFVQSKLMEHHPQQSADQVSWYAHSSQGSLGWAISAVGEDYFALNERILEGLMGLSALDISDSDEETGPTRNRSRAVPAAVPPDFLVPKWMESAAELGQRLRKQDKDISDTEATRRGLSAIFLMASNWYADVLRCRHASTAPLINQAHRKQLELASMRLDPESCAEAVERIARAEHQLDLNANTQLCIECLLQDLGDGLNASRDIGS